MYTCLRQDCFELSLEVQGAFLDNVEQLSFEAFRFSAGCILLLGIFNFSNILLPSLFRDNNKKQLHQDSKSPEIFKQIFFFF